MQDGRFASGPSLTGTNPLHDSWMLPSIEQRLEEAAPESTWVHRNGAPEGEVFVWAGGEAATLR